jgi:hypothetical protein
MIVPGPSQSCGQLLGKRRWPGGEACIKARGVEPLSHLSPNAKVRREKALVHSGWESRPGAGSFRPVTIEAVVEVQPKPPRHISTLHKNFFRVHQPIVAEGLLVPSPYPGLSWERVREVPRRGPWYTPRLRATAIS